MIWNIEGILERLGLRQNTVGIALSGGGARGFSHLGVLKAFEKFGIKPDVISGVSAGSIAAALYGAGLTTDEILDCFKSNELTDFIEWSIPKNSFMKIERFGKLLESWLPIKNLEDMKIPVVVCATDFDNAKSIGWGRGEIVPRVLASCSIPIIFPPVKINGTNYVDGGVLRNLPAWAIRDYVDTLYGVNCSPIRHNFNSKSSVIDVALRTFHIMMKSNTIQDLRLCDRVIAIDSIAHVKTFDLSSMKKNVIAGYDAACRTLEKYKKT